MGPLSRYEILHMSPDHMHMFNVSDSDTRTNLPWVGPLSRYEILANVFDYVRIFGDVHSDTRTQTKNMCIPPDL